jgi:hypothetical protein
MTLNGIRDLVNRFKKDDGVVDRGEAGHLVQRIKRHGVKPRELKGLEEIARSSLTRRADRFIDRFVRNHLEAAAK